ncbi:Actin- protein 2/3 complex subunit 2 [Desmophyllum pertusum]|uniref:Arp2/3 complex 34 kDa subunit n=1 Tax=Desmophyllum pertusum TaxID=174260 RepID=A0A9W9YLA5_9CNID|nr:Actin- protein 2/3 complex subunit 2 [Desmophyllum pertusum]
MKFYADLQKYGADELLKKVYGSLMTTTEEEELIQKLALLKRNCFASVFEKYFDYQQAGSGGEQHAVINYRDDESITVLKMMMMLSLAKFFMQEFKEGRRASQTAPQVLFSHKEPPKELQGTDAKTGDNIGYITFVLEPRTQNPKHVTALLILSTPSGITCIITSNVQRHTFIPGCEPEHLNLSKYSTEPDQNQKHREENYHGQDVCSSVRTSGVSFYSHNFSA